MASWKIPQILHDDDDLRRRFIVAISDAMTAKFDVSYWKRIATLHGLEREIEDNPRFLKSITFNDEDAAGNVLTLVKILWHQNPKILEDAYENDKVQRYIRQSDDSLYEAIQSQPDPVTDALVHSLDEVAKADAAFDLSTYTGRIQRSLPEDPANAVGASKEMLEATMRTILDRRKIALSKAPTFPELSGQCFKELGLSSSTPPASKAEGSIRKMASRCSAIFDALNELRNEAGSGHGRSLDTERAIPLEDAMMVSSMAMILASWLIKKSAT